MKGKNADFEKTCADHVAHLEGVKRLAKVVEILKKTAKAQPNNPDLEKAERKKQIEEKTALEEKSETQFQNLKNTVLTNGEMIRLLQEEGNIYKEDCKHLSKPKDRMEEERVANNAEEFK